MFFTSATKPWEKATVPSLSIWKKDTCTIRNLQQDDQITNTVRGTFHVHSHCWIEAGRKTVLSRVSTRTFPAFLELSGMHFDGIKVLDIKNKIFRAAGILHEICGGARSLGAVEACNTGPRVNRPTDQQTHAHNHKAQGKSTFGWVYSSGHYGWRQIVAHVLGDFFSFSGQHKQIIIQED